MASAFYFDIYWAFINSVMNLSEESFTQDLTHVNVISRNPVLVWTHTHTYTFSPLLVLKIQIFLNVVILFSTPFFLKK